MESKGLCELLKGWEIFSFCPMDLRNIRQAWIFFSGSRNDIELRMPMSKIARWSTDRQNDFPNTFWTMAQRLLTASNKKALS